MTTTLYLTPLRDASAESATGEVASEVAQAGLLQRGGTAVENVATDSVDLSVSGVFPYGALLSSKAAQEVDSLGESAYTKLPLYDPVKQSLGRQRGYYEVESANVNPAQPATEHVFQYDLTLTETGTRESHLRRITINSEDIKTELATGSPGQFGIPAAATKAKWFTASGGTEPASAVTTRNAEYGDVDVFDPADSTLTDPALLYDLEFAEEGSVDVRVYDDRDRSKFETVGNSEVSVWPHAFHTGFAFDGSPVVDNGLLRLRFDEANGVVEAFEWNDTNGTWDEVALTHGDLALQDADLIEVGPSDVRVIAEFVDTTDSTTVERAEVSVQRGIPGCIVRFPEGGATTQRVEDLFSPVASDQTTDLQPTQRLKARSET